MVAAPQSGRITKSSTLKTMQGARQSLNTQPNVTSTTESRVYTPIVVRDRTTDDKSTTKMVEVKKAKIGHYLIIAGLVIGGFYYINKKIEKQ